MWKRHVLAPTVRIPGHVAGRGRDGGPRRPLRLPAASETGRLAVEAALRVRRSLRYYGTPVPDLGDVAQLAWAAQGVTHPDGYRTAPSAGALYPLELYVVAGRVAGLPAGVHHYLPADHVLEPVFAGDCREALAAAAWDQDCIARAPLSMVLAGAFGRTERKYRDRGERYVWLEAGCAAENLALQAVALGLGSVVVAAFRDAEVSAVLRLPFFERPLLIQPVGALL
jgi:SagB-type dehydrogenase family enzyme